MNINDAAELLGSAIKLLPQRNEKSILNQAIQKCGFGHIPFELLPKEQTKDYLSYIKQFQLDKPENMIRFLVELHFASIDSVNSGICDIQETLLNDKIAKIDTARSLMVYAFDNPKDKDEKLSECITAIMGAVHELESFIQQSCEWFHEVDNCNAFQYLLHSTLDTKKTKIKGRIITTALQSLFPAIMLLVIIGNERRANVTSFLDETDSFFDSLTQNGYISLMQRWTLEPDRNEWSSEKINNQMDHTRSISDNLKDFLTDEAECEINFEELE